MGTFGETLTDAEDGQQSLLPQADETRLRSPSNTFGRALLETSPAPTLRLSTDLAKSRTPERAAEVMDLSQRSGMPQDLVDSNLDAVRAEVSKQGFDPDKFARESPVVARWIAEHPNHAAISKDDLTQLSALEWLMRAPVAAGVRGLENVEMNRLSLREMRGFGNPAFKLTPEQQARLEWLRAEEKAARPIAGPLWQRMIAGTAEQLPQTGGALLRGAREGVGGALTLGSAAAIVGQLGPQVATPEELITVPLAATAGFTAGMMTGAAEWGFEQEAGSAWSEYRRFKDPLGNQIEPEAAYAAAMAAGVINAGLEGAQVGFLLRSIPGAGRLFGAPARSAVTYALQSPTVRASLVTLVKEYGVNLAGEVATEVGQRAVTIMAGEIAKYQANKEGADFQMKGAGEIGSELVQEAQGAAESFALMLAPGHAMGLARDLQASRRAQTRTDYFRALGEGVASSKTYERLPSAIQDLVARATEGGPVENVRILADDWVGYWQTQGVDPMLMAERVVGSSKPLAEALATGGDLVIPTSQYATLLAPTEHGAELAQDLKLKADDLTGRQAVLLQEELKALTSRVEGEMQAEQAQEGGVETALSGLRDQLTATGKFTPDVVETYTKVLYSKPFRVLAARAGVDPVALAERYLPQVSAATEVPNLAFNQTQNVRQLRRDLYSIEDEINKDWFEGGTTKRKVWQTHDAGTRITNDKLLLNLGDSGKVSVVWLPFNPQLRDQALARVSEFADQHGLEIELLESAYGGIDELRKLIDTQKFESRILRKAGDAPTLNQVMAARKPQGQVLFQRAKLEPDTAGGVSPVATPQIQEEAEHRLGRALERDEKVGAPLNKRTVFKDKQGELVVGRITHEDWIKRVSSTMSTEELHKAREWYRQLFATLEPMYGERAPVIGLAWLLSQQNTTPSGGMLNVLRAMDLERGVPPFGYNKAGLAEDKIRSALRGEVPEAGLGAKLLDFVDSELGYTTRTVMGRDPRGGAPAVVDVWAVRDVGRVDPQTHNYITRRFGEKAAKKIVVDLPHSLSEAGYEYGSRFYNELTRELNARGFDGGDWIPSEVQAVGWVTMQRAMGSSPEFVGDIIGKNMRRVSLGLLPGEGAAHPAFETEVAQKRVTRLAELTGVKILESTPGAGAYLGFVEPAIQIDAFASPEAVEDFALALGYAFGQTEVWANRPFKAGKEHAVRIIGPGVNTMARATDLFERMHEYVSAAGKNPVDLIPGFQQTFESGQPGIRLINPEGHWRKGDLQVIQDAAAQAAEDLEMDVSDIASFPIQLLKVKNDWTTQKAGEGYTNALTQRGRAAIVAELEREFAPPGATKVFGQRVTTTTPEFKRWFGDSKVVDNQGKPLVVYHGRGTDFVVFDDAHLGKTTGNPTAVWGHAFGPADYASGMASGYGMRDKVAPNVVPVYLSLQNPKELTYAEMTRFQSLGEPPWDGKLEKLTEEAKAFRAELEAQGHDGIIVRTPKGRYNEYYAFRSEQIKSAVGNIGEFDPNNPSILAQSEGASRSAASSALAKIIADPEFQRELAANQKLADFAKDLKGDVKARVEYGNLLSRFHNWAYNVGDTLHSAKTNKNYKITGRTFLMQKMGEPLVATYMVEGSDGSKQTFREPALLADPNLDVLYQEPGKVRAASATDANAQQLAFIQIAEGRKFEIGLLEKANLSSFIHETGHLYLEILGDLAAQTSDESFKRDYQTILRWFGVDSREQIKTEHHEKFARGIEAYFMEGVAPSSALREVFLRVRQWMKRIYVELTALDVNLTPEVRDVFDRIFATDVEIDLAKQEDRLSALFIDAKTAGMTDNMFNAYQERLRTVSLEGRERLQARMMRDIKRAQTDEYSARKEAVTTQVQKEVYSEPVYRAISALRRNTLPDGTPIDLEPVKLSRDGIEAVTPYRTGREALRGLEFMYSKDGGMHPDSLAEQYGFTSGAEMLSAIRAAEPMNARISRQVKAKLDAEFGDMLANDEKRRDQAIRSLYTDARVDVVEMELKALERLVRQAQPVLRATQREQRAERATGMATLRSVPGRMDLRRMAEGMIRQTTVRNLDPQNYLRTARQAAGAALNAVSRGDYIEAAAQKRNELFNMALYDAAFDAREQADDIARYMRKFERTTVRARLGKAGHDYLDQVDAIMTRFEFARVPFKSLDKRQALLDWIHAKQDAGETFGEEFTIAPRLIDEATRVNYRQLSFDELLGIYDTIRQVEHLAAFKNRLLAKAGAQEWADTKAELVGAIHQNLKHRPPAPLTRDGIGTFSKLAGAAREFDASLLKMEQLVGWLDGGDTGPWHTFWWDGAADAQGAEYDLTKTITAKITDAVQNIPAEVRKHMLDKVELTQTRVTMVRKALLAIALNTGNESNHQKMLKGMGWTKEQVAEMLDHLTKGEWDFVQSVWDTLESMWPDIAKLQKELTGLEPDKVEIRPVQTKFGELKGGYYPVMYDPTLSDRGGLQLSSTVGGLIDNNYVRATTPKGHTHSRIEEFSRPFDFNLDRLPSHVAGVVKDLTHRKWLMDANKILRDTEIRKAINDTLGPEYVKLFEGWVRTVANDRNVGNLRAMDIWHRNIEHIRFNTTIAALGLKVATITSQLAGLGPSIDLVGVRYMTAGLAKFMANPFGAYTFVTELSGEMRHRLETRDDTIRDQLRQLGGRKDIIADIKRFSLYGISVADMMVSLPTWLGAYQQVLDQKGTKEDAIRAGDRAVRLSQGAGGAKDLALVATRSNTLMRLFTMFYTPFSALYARLRDIGHEFGGIRDVPRAAIRCWWVWLMPAIMAELLTGRAPDDESDPEDWARFLSGIALYPLASIPIARDAVSYLTQGYTYQFSPLAQFGKSTADLIKQINETVTDDGELSDLARKTLRASGYWLGLPVSQLMITGDYLLDLSSGEEEPESLRDFFSGLLFRRKD